MAIGSLSILFLLQLSCVAAISVAVRRGLPDRLNLLLSSLFVTVPAWAYPPLYDAGIVYLFDLVVPTLLLSELLLGRFALPIKPVVFVGVLVLFLPLFYAPIGYFFLDPAYIAYHTLILATVLYRSLLIVVAVAILVRELRNADQRSVVRLMGVQFLVLFAFGALQYLVGVDFVVYERIKDVENVVDLMLSGEEKILFGFGFMGLFRGAVPQMAVAGIFWWLVVNMRKPDVMHNGSLLVAMCLLALICVVGSLSRIGILAIACVLVYVAFINHHMRFWTAASLIVGGPLLLFGSYLDTLQGVGVNLMMDRFSVEQFTGQVGSGGGRVEAAITFYQTMQESWLPWVVGVGGFNPIAANEYYGMFGMHGDYLDVIARYGLLVGLLFLGLVLFLFIRLLGGFMARDRTRREIPRAFGALAIGVGILALTQGALTFSGAAGYLASAQTWLAIAFCIAVRGRSGLRGGSLDELERPHLR